MEFKKPNIEKFFSTLTEYLHSISGGYIIILIWLSILIGIEIWKLSQLSIYEISVIFIVLHSLILLVGYFRYRHKSKKIERFLIGQAWYLNLDYEWKLSIPKRLGLIKNQNLDKLLSRYYIRFEYNLKATNEIVSIHANTGEDPSQVYSWIISLKPSHSSNEHKYIIDKVDLGKLKHALNQARIFIHFRKKNEDLKLDDVIKLYKDMPDYKHPNNK